MPHFVWGKLDNRRWIHKNLNNNVCYKVCSISFDSRNISAEEEQNRARTEKSFFVPKEEIVENDYDLSINKYKEIVIEKKEYENPKVILKRVIEMEDEIQQKLKELEDILWIIKN